LQETLRLAEIRAADRITSPAINTDTEKSFLLNKKELDNLLVNSFSKALLASSNLPQIRIRSHDAYKTCIIAAVHKLLPDHKLTATLETEMLMQYVTLELKDLHLEEDLIKKFTIDNKSEILRTFKNAKASFANKIRKKANIVFFMPKAQTKAEINSRISSAVLWNSFKKAVPLITDSDIAFAEIIVNLFVDGKTLKDISETEFAKLYQQKMGIIGPARTPIVRFTQPDYRRQRTKRFPIVRILSVEEEQAQTPIPNQVAEEQDDVAIQLMND